MNKFGVISNIAVQWVKSRAPEGGMMRGALALGGATLATQVVGVLLSPVYSRLYTPADYGVLSIYSAIVMTALTVGSLCYERGIPIAKDDGEAVGLTAIGVVLVVLVGFGTVAFLGLMALMRWDGPYSQLGDYLWLVPVGISVAGVYNAVTYWALRRQATGAIARTSISQVVTSNTINLGFGILHPTPLGLILSGIAGTSAGMMGLARRTELIPRMRAERGLRPLGGQLLALAKKYQRLPLVSAPSTLFNSLGLYLPGILLAPYYGAGFAGQFFMGMKLIGLPASLIGRSLSQVFLSSAATVARERPHELAHLFHRVFIRGAACSSLIVLGGLVAPFAVVFVLGEKWRPAGEITLWLSLYSGSGLTVSALSSVPNIVGRLRGQFLIDLSRAFAVFLLLFFGHRADLSGMAVVKGYTLIMIVNYLACYCLYSYQVKLVARTGLTGWNKTITTRRPSL